MNKRHGVEGGADENEIGPFQGLKEGKGCQEVQKKVARAKGTFPSSLNGI